MREMMLQQVMTEPKKITFREIEIPEPSADQVLVKIKKIGICGSDIHVYHGLHPYTSYPVTQGARGLRSDCEARRICERLRSRAEGDD